MAGTSTVIGTMCSAVLAARMCLLQCDVKGRMVLR